MMSVEYVFCRYKLIDFVGDVGIIKFKFDLFCGNYELWFRVWSLLLL